MDSTLFTRLELAAIADLCRCVGGHDLLLKKVEAIIKEQDFDGHVWVDVPDKDALGDEEAGWTNATECESVAEAVAWLRERGYPCDENGNLSLSLLTLGDPREAVG